MATMKDVNTGKSLTAARNGSTREFIPKALACIAISRGPGRKPEVIVAELSTRNLARFSQYALEQLPTAGKLRINGEEQYVLVLPHDSSESAIKMVASYMHKNAAVEYPPPFEAPEDWKLGPLALLLKTTSVLRLKNGSGNGPIRNLILTKMEHCPMTRREFEALYHIARAGVLGKPDIIMIRRMIQTTLDFFVYQEIDEIDARDIEGFTSTVPELQAEMVRLAEKKYEWMMNRQRKGLPVERQAYDASYGTSRARYRFLAVSGHLIFGLLTFC